MSIRIISWLDILTEDYACDFCWVLAYSWELSLIDGSCWDFYLIMDYSGVEDFEWTDDSSE